ncbi:hypothetical protein [Cryptosporangium minutisporangium]|uniref:Uncharacterized protein n=1 Tax=Cryptosporangium minutisporangium TaxID=113569 RepID=A0ABP6SR85_9ACTN
MFRTSADAVATAVGDDLATAAPSAIDDAFYALITADPELLRAEFEELVDTAWEPPEPPPPDDASGPEDPAPRPAPPDAGCRCGRGRRPGGVRRRRERSPPESRSEVV